jgi:hypothetical protein
VKAIVIGQKPGENHRDNDEFLDFHRGKDYVTPPFLATQILPARENQSRR